MRSWKRTLWTLVSIYSAGALATTLYASWYIIESGALRRSHPNWTEWAGGLAFYGGCVVLWPVFWALWLLNWLGFRVSISF